LSKIELKINIYGRKSCFNLEINHDYRCLHRRCIDPFIGCILCHR
jgi:hypothetical protein